MAAVDSEFGEWPLKRLMTEVVGTGTKSAEDMTREQAMEAMRRILADEPDHTTLGAFWLANRWKHNNAEELAGFTDVMAEHVEYAEPEVDPVDCGANYDGKGKTAILGVAAGITAAAAGTPVVVHSGDRVPTQKQDAYKHVLDELGVRTELDPDESADMVDETGFGFYYQPKFNPAIHALWERRDNMGVRTFVNTIETIANPANASTHLGSFYHLAFAKKMVNTFEASEHHDLHRVVMFQGMEGYDDIRPGYTKVAEWTDGEFDDFEIETADYGMDFEYDDLGVDEDDVAGDSAEITEAVLSGDREDRFADAVALNAALRIYAREDADSIDEGLEMAREAIDSGAAADVLEDLRAF
ncbi:anthranilate phosphoribosyltransferase [Haloferax mediterranei ATCC 33500]|uniref:Anthranilate phosphoribosyltransferase n=1 Tax=Haloferax mediterranei (strain ATCC 33500 / DSM 1411 / JCM 8866 / NBRC 14739 / NCIMB 2177 / R-4) TaxID=523841 RepID=I3R6V5_HALMT|nr:anthranilate phosphoribosyltransferase [Haloferax mediterranei]AFK19965.1 anthranilate phosphoribosyltransferase [Haloferax mediterranei ATCC 33500]AHZ23342.1 anthranilate phosphoribosyltransferase [Haloferax mediterranei ATCC 33500]ELZ99510.1 anthranilate phosphoribosyltransferase [Haloferax mediterranei ATCC 33500]MDX5987284.1 anthranilate phosphoribosyltransferase [Haloferax mediterranei ATCC 33500]QCQ73805.1 anthranilate phosphoribosyltransferase [Haloferax mediterranei ATCC 33500]